MNRLVATGTGAGQGGQSELWEELNVKHQWFHILRAAIIDNRIAEMGTSAWAVYCVIKAYAQMNTGESFPSQAKIAGHIGVSVDTVQRAIDRLIELKLVTREKVGRRSQYHLIESFPLERKSDGERVGQVDHQYMPMQFSSLVEQIKAYALSGRLPPGATFNVTLNVTTINQGDNSTVNINQVSVAEPNGRSDAVYSAAIGDLSQRARALRGLDL